MLCLLLYCVKGVSGVMVLSCAGAERLLRKTEEPASASLFYGTEVVPAGLIGRDPTVL